MSDRLMKIFFRSGFSLVLALSIASAACILGAMFMGIGFATLPEAHIDLVSDVVCSDGASLTYEEGGESTYLDEDGFTRTATDVFISCESAAGQRDSSPAVTLRTIGTLFALYFAACFLPLIVIALLVVWVGLPILRRVADRSNALGNNQEG